MISASNAMSHLAGSFLKLISAIVRAICQANKVVTNVNSLTHLDEPRQRLLCGGASVRDSARENRVLHQSSTSSYEVGDDHLRQCLMIPGRCGTLLFGAKEYVSMKLGAGMVASPGSGHL